MTYIGIHKSNRNKDLNLEYGNNNLINCLF